MGKIFGSQREEKAKIFSKGLTRSMCVHKSEDTTNKYNHNRNVFVQGIFVFQAPNKNLTFKNNYKIKLKEKINVFFIKIYLPKQNKEMITKMSD